MANPNRVAGQATITVDGDRLETDGTSTLDLGGPVREAVQGDYQAGSFRESTKEAKLECTVLLKGGTSVTNLRNADDVTATLQTDVGQVYVMRNAYLAETISISTSDGKAKLVFQGPPAEELV